MSLRRPLWRCAVGVALVSVTVSLLVAVVTAGSAAAAPIPGAKAGECSKAATGNNYDGTNSKRDLSSVFPDWINAVSYPCDYPQTVRGIRMAQTVIELVQGGQISGGSPSTPRARSPCRRSSPQSAIPRGSSRRHPASSRSRAAFVQAEGTSLVVAAPDVTDLRLQSGVDGIFFGGTKATARFEAVTVTSWDDASQAPAQLAKGGQRPHVLYEDGSRLDLINSTFQFLGSDHTVGYGVSWRVGGSTGEVVGSVFQYNFFGVYTFEAANIVFHDNVFRDNIYYGADPHDSSVGLVFEHNEAYGNGSHGIIFSRYVNHSVVRNNYSHDNGGNGIMMDFHSDSNVIENNVVVDNHLEGIVSSGSADLLIKTNKIRGSSVGVRLSRNGADRVTIAGNNIADVTTGIKAYNGATAASIAGIGSSASGAQVWSWRRRTPSRPAT